MPQAHFEPLTIAVHQFQHHRPRLLVIGPGGLNQPTISESEPPVLGQHTAQTRSLLVPPRLVAVGIVAPGEKGPGRAIEVANDNRFHPCPGPQLIAGHLAPLGKHLGRQLYFRSSRACLVMIEARNVEVPAHFETRPKVGIRLVTESVEDIRAQDEIRSSCPETLHCREQRYVMNTVLTVTRKGRKSDFSLAPSGTTIGRNPDCDIVLTSSRVSRRHARIFQDPFGRWVVEDLGSTKGTLVNGQPVGVHALLPGEALTIGPFSAALNMPLA